MTFPGLSIRLARLLLRHSIRPILRRVLPEVFRELDSVLPSALMQKVAPAVIEGIILRAVVKRTAITPSLEEIEAIAGLFDPRRAAKASQPAPAITFARVRDAAQEAAKRGSILPHQLAALSRLDEILTDDQRRQFTELWRAQGSPAAAPPTPSPVLLSVPYFSQHDNGPQGWRECASSSAAMVAAFWGKVDTDDAYNLVREKFGDTTEVSAQVQALRSLGLDARFRTDGTPALLEQEIRAGRPVMVGWLHRGPVSAPTGGGHWSVVIGFDTLSWTHHDPNGEADMVNGGYVNRTNGRKIRYSRRNWERRWRPDGGGWCILVQPL